MTGEPVKTITTVQQVDKDGNVIAETVTTVEATRRPEPPNTGMYL
ncbi:MAG: hypothetical protein ACRD0W_00640 [Acidimicrobiales bacterium]